MEISGIARDLAGNIGVRDVEGARVVHLRQSGRLRQDASSRWMPFSATQTIETRVCGFDWRARSGPGGLVHIRDALVEGEGELRVRLFGLLPVARVSGSPEVTRGELMRYLAELAWAPHAILANSELRWRREAADRLIVSVGAAQVTLLLDDRGRVAATYAPDRPRAVGKRFVPTPWKGYYAGYTMASGLWLPQEARVAWVLDGAELTCFEGRVDDWRVSPG